MLQNVSSFKYLCFTLDSALTFKSHLSDVNRKVIHKRTLLSRLRTFLSKSNALSIYKAMILPYFDFCTVVNHGASSSQLDKLHRLQNKRLKQCAKVYTV